MPGRSLSLTWRPWPLGGSNQRRGRCDPIYGHQRTLTQIRHARFTWYLTFKLKCSAPVVGRRAPMLQPRTVRVDSCDRSNRSVFYEGQYYVAIIFSGVGRVLLFIGCRGVGRRKGRPEDHPQRAAKCHARSHPARLGPLEPARRRRCGGTVFVHRAPARRCIAIEFFTWSRLSETRTRIKNTLLASAATPTNTAKLKHYHEPAVERSDTAGYECAH